MSISESSWKRAWQGGWFLGWGFFIGWLVTSTVLNVWGEDPVIELDAKGNWAVMLDPGLMQSLSHGQDKATMEYRVIQVDEQGRVICSPMEGLK